MTPLLGKPWSISVHLEFSQHDSDIKEAKQAGITGAGIIAWSCIVWTKGRSSYDIPSHVERPRRLEASIPHATRCKLKRKHFDVNKSYV